MVKSKKLTNKYNLYVDEKAKIKIREGLASEVPTKNIQFPSDLGAEHPFDYTQLEGVYKKFGPATGAVDKYVDYIVGPGFYVKSKNPKAQEVIEQFIHDINFDTVLREWVKQAIIKGMSPLELGEEKGKINELKVLNSNYIYVKRDKRGKITGFSQYVGAFDKFNKSKVIPLFPKQIAFLNFNKIGDSPYGIGILYPALNTINYILQSEKDMHMLMSRKANSPLHVKLGNMDKDDIPTEADVTAYGQKLEYMTNKQEWCTGPNVEMKPIDFGNLSDKFSFIMESDLRSFRWTVQIPEMLMGEGNIAEGLGNVQMDGWMRRVQSFQAEIEKIVELEIFDRVLAGANIDADIEFEWGQPSSAETDAKINKLTALLQNPMLSTALKDEMELQIAGLLGIDKDKLQTPEAQREKEEKRSQPLVPGQQAKAPVVEPEKEKEKEKFYNKQWFEGELVHEN